MTTTGDRRPIASRDTPWARAMASRLAGMGVTPNQVSQASMAAAALAGVAFWLSSATDGWLRAVLLLTAAVGCQLRLLCNLFDGMIAVEGGRGGPDGPFWNEFPDRVADLMILVGAGLAVGSPALGWAAAAMAIFTAYVREHGRAVGAPADFSGPMAKQHRMALVTVAAIVATVEPIWNGRGAILTIALWLVAAGAAVTVLRRAAAIVRHLGGKTANRQPPP